MKLQDRISDYEPRYITTKKFWKLIRHKTWREYDIVEIHYNMWVMENKKAD